MFRVFVAGQTISDGRTITPEMVNQCAGDLSTPRPTPAHQHRAYLGYSPEPPPTCCGDVVALEARDVELEIAISPRSAARSMPRSMPMISSSPWPRSDQKPFLGRAGCPANCRSARSASSISPGRHFPDEQLGSLQFQRAPMGMTRHVVSIGATAPAMASGRSAFRPIRSRPTWRSLGRATWLFIERRAPRRGEGRSGTISLTPIRLVG